MMYYYGSESVIWGTELDGYVLMVDDLLDDFILPTSVPNNSYFIPTKEYLKLYKRAAWIIRYGTEET